MAYLQLDEQSQKALRLSGVMLIAAPACILLHAAATALFDVPGWVSLLSGVCFFALLGGSFVLSRRVKCPYCAEPAVNRLAPSWHKPLPAGGRGTLRCSFCHALVDIRGHRDHLHSPPG